jgi:hypothetical protein
MGCSLSDKRVKDLDQRGLVGGGVGVDGGDRANQPRDQVLGQPCSRYVTV